MALVRVTSRHCVVNVATGTNRKPKRNRWKEHRITPPSSGSTFQTLSLNKYVKRKEFRENFQCGASGQVTYATRQTESKLRNFWQLRKVVPMSAATLLRRVLLQRSELTWAGTFYGINFGRLSIFCESSKHLSRFKHRKINWHGMHVKWFALSPNGFITYFA